MSDVPLSKLSDPTYLRHNGQTLNKIILACSVLVVVGCAAYNIATACTDHMQEFYTVLPEEVLKGVEKSGANTDTWCIVSVGQPTSVGCVEGRTDDKQPTSCYEPCKMSLTGEGSKEAVGYEISMCPDAPEVDEGAPDCPYPGHGDRSYKPALYIFYLEWTTCVNYFTAVQAAFALQGTAAALALFAFGRMSMFSERTMTVSALETEKPSKASKKITPESA